MKWDSTAVLVVCTMACSAAPEKPDREGAGSETGAADPVDSGTPGGSNYAGVLGEVKPCPDPLPSVSWTERSETSGLPSRPDDGRPTEEAVFIAVDDFDLDGDLDLLTSVSGASEAEYPEPVRVHHWTGESFELDPAVEVEALWQPTLGDVDGDGLRDVLLAGGEEWLRNDAGSLKAVPLMGIDGERMSLVRMMAPVDLNQDGHLDVYSATSDPEGDAEALRDFVAWGNSMGNFTLDPTALPAPVGGVAFSAQWIDWTGDGRPEVYVANDQGYLYGANRLWSWDTEPPVDRAPELGANRAHDAMGAHIADWNRDGQPDIYLSATEANVLLVSQPDGSLVDITRVSGADPMAEITGVPGLMGWGGVFTDYDNDGQLDVFATLGDWWSEPDDPRTEMGLYLLKSDGESFESVGPAVGIDGSGSFRGVVARDFNDDGVLDYLVSSLFGRPLWFVSDGCTASNWLEVEAPDSSRVTITIGDEQRVGWASTQSGYGAAATPVAHFGLGEHTTIDGLQVVLPGGELWSMTGPIDARRRITLSP